MIDIISALIGAFVSVITAIYVGKKKIQAIQIKSLLEASNKIQEKIAEHQLETSKLRAKIMRDKLEELYLTLDQISDRISMKQMCVDSDNGTDINEHHRNYEKITEMAQRAIMIARLYFPGEIQSLDDLRGQISCAWGENMILIKSSNGDIQRLTIQEISNIVRQVSSIVWIAQCTIERLAKEYC